MSFRDIGVILKKASAAENENSQTTDKMEQQPPLSVSAQSYKLFSEGKTLVDVAVSLNLTQPELTVAIYLPSPCVPFPYTRNECRTIFVRYKNYILRYFRHMPSLYNVKIIIDNSLGNVFYICPTIHSKDQWEFTS